MYTLASSQTGITDLLYGGLFLVERGWSCGLVGSTLDYNSLPPEFKSRCRHI